MNLLTLANILSVLPLIIICFNILRFIILTITNKKLTNHNYLCGILIATIIPQLIKKIPWHKNTYNITMRPKGARDTNYLSNNGICPDNTPGFPSGHMSTTAYIIMYNILYILNNYDSFNIIQRYILILSNIIILCLMGWARIYKKCHTFIQVCVGIIIGIIVAYIIFNKY